MNKYISRILLLLLSVSFLGNSARAEELASGGPGRIVVLCMGIISVGLGKFAYSYINNRSLESVMQERLDLTFYQDPKTFTFQKYRTVDKHGDGYYWETASEILDQKGRVRQAIHDDIIQGDRIYISNTPCKLTIMETEENIKKVENKNSGSESDIGSSSSKIGKKTKNKVNNQEIQAKENEAFRYKEIKKALSIELDSLNKVIQQLAQYVDIENLLNNGIENLKNNNKNWITYPILPKYNLHNYYIIFSKITPEQLATFTGNLEKEIQSHNTSWKKFICPRYKELSLQYWQFVQRYIRVQALKNVVDEYFDGIIKNICDLAGGETPFVRSLIKMEKQ